MIKLLLECVPIIIFFITYKHADINKATLVIMISTCISLLLNYVIYKQLSLSLLISGGVLLIMGLLSLSLNDSRYIKMKPTIVYIIMAGSLYVSCIKRNPLVKNVLSNIYKLDDKYWIILSYRCAHYCVFIAIVNEFTWRYCSESFWVNFKVFGMFPITMVFFLFQLPLILKNQKNQVN